MNTNEGRTNRPHGLRGPVAVSAAAAVPPSRGSPPGRYLADAAPRAEGTGGHAAAAREGRQS